MKQPVAVEMYYGSQWHDITAAELVRVADEISISRGQQDEGAAAKPSSLSMRLDNRTGWALPTNPPSPLYDTGGLYTPVAVYLTPGLTSTAQADIVDTFDGRTVSTGWGTASDGVHAWQLATIGSSTATDWSVGSGQAVHYVDSAVEARFSVLPTVAMQDVDVRVTWSCVAATGGDLEPANILYRYRDANTWGMVRVTISTAGVIQLKCYRADTSAEISPAVTVAGITHPGTSNTYVLRVATIGQSVMAKLWLASGSEPADWTAIWTDPSAVLTGGFGIRSGRAAGNTSTTNPQFRYHDLTVAWRDVRAVQEVHTWEPGQTAGYDISGWLTGSDGGPGDAWTDITAGGVLHRLNAGKDPLQSALERFMVANPPATWWPLDDPRDSTRLRSRVENVSDIGQEYTVNGVVAWRASEGTLSDFYPASLGGLTEPTADTYLAVRTPRPPAVDTGVWTASLLVSGLNSSSQFEIIWYGAGDSGAPNDKTNWYLSYNSPSWLGQARLFVIHDFANTTDTLTQITTPANVTLLDERMHHIQFRATRNSTSTDYSLWIDGTVIASGTAAHGWNPYAGMAAATIYTDGSAVGHFASWNSAVDSSAAGLAHAGESPSVRFGRLCDEEGVPWQVEGSGDTDTMGPQEPATLVALLNEAATTGDAMLYEPRGWSGLVLRTRAAMYDQAAAVTLAYAGGGVKTVPPVVDTKGLRNDVTVRNWDGVTVRDEITDGPAGVATRGRITDSVDVSHDTLEQLGARVGWELSKGTLIGSRYPRIVFDLDAAPSLRTTVAIADLGRRFVLTGLEADAIGQIIRAQTEVIGSHRRLITYMGLPDTLWMPAVYDDTDFRYDAGTSTTTSAISSSATSVSVTTTDRYDLWATGATSFPIIIGGEVMTVTNISGATSPQTFTVTRSVNGVVKAHAAGSTVDTWPRPRYAL